ncbi:MAG: D-alanyl-D-alanine carboxypeptidase [Actinomycetota bacterium]|nr:D-alanyl-D-alanine carboxypeptidase [Rubrobacteraceae bacterium]MDQ3497034.1 D-alanyl-D-alanine carboxypeptidase [Actinomycetota bacterium]
MNLVKGAATFITLLILLVLVPVSDRPVAQETKSQAPPGSPKLAAGSWTLIDADTGLYLAGKDPDKRVAIASTTKIMVALVALDEGVDLDEQVTVSEDAASYAGSIYSNVGLYPYDRVSVRDLLTAALVPSGTDAVYALTEHLGDGSVDEFVARMNDKAKELGLDNTQFENPAGIDARGNYSSASDLAKITREAMKYPEFREIVGKPEATISTQDREIDVFTTNLLVAPGSGYDYGPATGVKTGTSAQAGPCLVATAESGDESYIAVVLDAAGDLQRFEAATTALEYGFGEYEREPLVERGDSYADLKLPYRRGETVKLVAAKDVSALAGPGLEVERRPTNEEAPPSAETGRKLGTVAVSVEGRKVGNSPLVVQKGYEAASLWQKVTYWAGGLKRWILSR